MTATAEITELTDTMRAVLARYAEEPPTVF